MNRTSIGWGGVSCGIPARLLAPASTGDLKQIFASEEQRSFLGRGLGRSYGDCALNTGGTLIDCRCLNHLLSFDPADGILECEAGISILEINRLLTTTGWMLPVVPGTQFVSIGGAIANDVHGKNHVQKGSFGVHLLALKLARSNGELLECSAKNNSALFAATIGGLGLTGLILSAKLQLRPIRSLVMNTTRFSFDSLTELFSMAAEQLESWEYHAAWMDPAAGCRRGHYIVANHSGRQGNLNWPQRRGIPLGLLAGLPSDLPGRLLMKAGNFWYRHGIRCGARKSTAEAVFYPLDRLPDWNAAFGKMGFYQYQCVLPTASALAALDELLAVVAESGLSVSLAVGKWFGARSSPGLLSFPLAGFTVSLDFTNRGSSTRRLMGTLDTIVAGCGGRLYPAKDASMSAALFADGYPKLESFAQQLDPCFASDFWRRMELSK